MVANDGVMMKPQFVKHIKKGTYLEKELIQLLNPSLCSDETILDLKELLEGLLKEEQQKI